MAQDKPNYDEMTDEELEERCDEAEGLEVENHLERKFREEVEASERLEHMRYETRNDGEGR